MGKKIYYKKGYKYCTSRTYTDNIEIKPPEDVKIDFVTLTKDGNLTIRKYYATDGPSGPTIDTGTFMRGAIVHDALYQLMEEGKLSWDHRKAADKILLRICKEDDMCLIRRQYVYFFVRTCYGLSRRFSSKGKECVAP